MARKTNKKMEKGYTDLCAWINEYAANNPKHANLRVSNFEECNQDFPMLSCPLENATGLSAEFSDSLESEFTGATFYAESRAMVDLPIRFTPAELRTLYYKARDDLNQEHTEEKCYRVKKYKNILFEVMIAQLK